MTLSDLGSIANLLSAIAVLATLVYLAIQVKQSNRLARSQSRQRMIEQTQQELYQWIDNPDLREAFLSTKTPSPETQSKMHFFLLSALRQREWEWFQYKDGIINEDVYVAYHGVIALHLGIPRTRKWWQTVGRMGFNASFVSEVDAFLQDQPLTEKYYEDIRCFDAPAAEEASVSEVG
ncbi:MAG: hypothetical protein WA989_13710 [Henriciella sp.]|uniref:hypothetical protein n=1 Tax=Henriciella sp. TaxID=1968823 RepID=UPI003C74D71E